MSKKLVAAGFLVFRRITGSTEYLFLQTSYGSNHWTPPKGHVDPGESELEAAYRETEEEAGLSKHHLRIIEGFKKTLHYEASGVPKCAVYWLAELNSSDIAVKLSDEHVKFEWCTLDKALKLIPDFVNMQEMLKEADAFLMSLLSERNKET